ERKIQTRMIFAGNIVRQPAMVEGGYKYKVVDELKNTDKVMRDAFWIGVYPGLTEEMLIYIVESIKEFVKKWVKRGVKNV
ncbi:MAG: hypothetical protein DRP28_06820, partial [Thermodesulfobacteriota bacterium]